MGIGSPHSMGTSPKLAGIPSNSSHELQGDYGRGRKHLGKKYHVGSYARKFKMQYLFPSPTQLNITDPVALSLFNVKLLYS